MKRFSYLFSALALVCLAACSAPSNPTPDPTPTPSGTGTISGEIRGTDALGLSLDIPEDAEYVPGEVIVAFVDDEPGTVRTASMELQSIRSLSVPGVSLFHTGNEDPAEVAAYLNAQPDVRYAQPNYIMHPAAVSNPNDYYWQANHEYFWNYEAINVPDAWDLVGGTEQIVVAVIDSGIVVDLPKKGRHSHEDLEDSVVLGYDFISNPVFAADGDGRDNDPYDPGGNPTGEPRYHGTHVAGTIGATTNNGIGIPAVGWDAQILPVRALGHGGGSLVDIMEGAMWAAGIEIDGVPNNVNPAHVLNMSLGAPGPCSAFMQDSFARIANETFAIPIVAAGNKDVDVSGVTPANCPHVITVAASGYIGANQGPASAELAEYSNYGNLVDVVAPGGEQSEGEPYKGILSTWADESTGEPGYGWSIGTSMAAPHVSGIVAMMKAMDSDLTIEQVRYILRSTARQMNCPTNEPCGAGLVDALAALEQIDFPIIDPSANITITPQLLNFSTHTNRRVVEVENNGANTVTVEINTVPIGNTPHDWLDGPTSITVQGGQMQPAEFAVNRDILGDGSYSGEIHFTNSSDNKLLGVVYVMIDQQSAQVDPSDKAMYLLSWVTDPNAPDGWADSAFYCEDAPFDRFYNVNALPGDNIVAAFIDMDGDRDLSPGDWLGVADGVVRVFTGEHTTVQPFYVAPYTDADAQYHLEIPEARVRAAIQTAAQKECL